MARIRFACERCSRPLAYGEECHCKGADAGPRQEPQPVPSNGEDLQFDAPAGNPPAPRKRGRPKKVFLEPSTPENPNLLAPWYRGTGTDNTELNHAWYIGYAPADDPQIAFAVMVEYGGSGGGPTCVGIAKATLAACIEHGHLTVKPAAGDADAQAASGR